MNQADLQRLYLDPSGRVPRYTYWMFGVLPAFGMSIALLFVELVNAFLLSLPLPMGIINFAVYAALLYAITVKRLHDRDKSASWILLYWGVPTISYILILLSADFSLGILPIPALLSLGIGLWALIDLGILEGTQGENRYGPVPQRPHEDTSLADEQAIHSPPLHLKICPYCAEEVPNSTIRCPICESYFPRDTAI